MMKQSTAMTDKTAAGRKVARESGNK